jgi:chaperonin GroEL (HSP60 family)
LFQEGGVALVRCSSALDKLKLSGDEKHGLKILKKALEEPLRQIVENAGYEGSPILNKVLEGKDDYGFNVARINLRTFWQPESLILQKWYVLHSRTQHQYPV